MGGTIVVVPAELVAALGADRLRQVFAAWQHHIASERPVTKLGAEFSLSREKRATDVRLPFEERTS